MPKASDPEKTAWDGGSPKERKSTNPSPVEEHWTMRLYVAGQSSRSVTAITNLRRLCEEHMGNRCTIEIIDLVRKMPPPVRRIIGDLSATEKVLVSLEIESGATS